MSCDVDFRFLFSHTLFLCCVVFIGSELNDKMTKTFAIRISTVYFFLKILTKVFISYDKTTKKINIIFYYYLPTTNFKADVFCIKTVFILISFIIQPNDLPHMEKEMIGSILKMRKGQLQCNA